MGLLSVPWVNGDKIEAARLENLRLDHFNKDTNLHPQYGTNLGSAAFGANTALNSGKIPFYHIKNTSPHGTNKIRIILSTTITSTDPKFNYDIRGPVPANTVIVASTDIAFSSGVISSSVTDITFNQPTGSYYMPFVIKGTITGTGDFGVALVALAP